MAFESVGEVRRSRLLLQRDLRVANEFAEFLVVGADEIVRVARVTAAGRNSAHRQKELVVEKIDPRLRKALAGISGILVTPFDPSDRIAPQRLRPIVDRAVEA